MTMSFGEILRIYPNATTITFVNRHLDNTGYNTSRLNESVIRSLLNEIERERKEDEPDECPLKMVVFTYYDYEGDIFATNRGMIEKKQYFDEEILRDDEGMDNREHPLRKRLREKG